VNRDDLRASLTNPNVKAFLAVIRKGEGTSDEAGYSRHFGGKQFSSFDDHPREVIRANGYASSAAGAYQYLSGTWDNLVRLYGFPDFSPQCQDEGAIALIAGRGALDDVIAGRLETAIAKCCKEWASLPGSPYGQPTRSMEQALDTYAKAGGTLHAEAPQSPPAPETAPQTQPEHRMPIPAILAALLPSIVEAIPKLASIFKPGSEVAERNVKAAEFVADLAVKATNSVNAQEAVEKIKADSVALQAVSKAVEDNWWQLSEVAGGIEGARKADAAFIASGGHVWESPSFWALCLMLPIVYLIVGAVIGLWGKMTLSGEVTASIITGIVTLVIGGASGFYWGSTTSRNKPAAQ
jgi:muramidase (phage lysozyme)